MHPLEWLQFQILNRPLRRYSDLRWILKKGDLVIAVRFGVEVLVIGCLAIVHGMPDGLLMVLRLGGCVAPIASCVGYLRLGKGQCMMDEPGWKIETLTLPKIRKRCALMPIASVRIWNRTIASCFINPS